MSEEDLKQKIKLFIDRAIQRNSQASNDIVNNDIYRGFKLKISFGAGKYASKPWMAFLKDKNEVQNGLYPIISYFFNEKLLVVGKGVSDANESYKKWVLFKDDLAWDTLPSQTNACKKCYYKKYYKITSIDELPDNILDEIIFFINKIMDEYQVKQVKQFCNIKNIILYGPPGVGKTHNYQRLISMIEEGRDEKTIFDTVTNNQSSKKIVLEQEIYQKIHKEERVEFITFHQSYSYEDFIEGFRPTEDGNIKLEDGIFKRVVKKAFDNREKNYYIVIDEINRGNISKIFGELITLLEEDKRDSYEVTLPYSKEKFVIPSNLYIIATMNSTDKSIATIDIALRRRFTFLKMQPNSNLVQNEEAKALMNSLNMYIGEKLGSDFLLGHSYFMGEDVDLEFIKEYKIRPLLEEYFYADETLDIDKLLNGENNAT